MSHLIASSRRIVPVASATISLSLALAPLASSASVFDDAVVWYRGALEAQTYYSNGPEGTFANNGGKTAKAFKSILHTANPSSAPAMSWSWGWGAETTLDSAPVYCPYAATTLTGVTYANRPVPVKTNDWANVTVDGNTSSQPVLSHWKGPEYLNSGTWVSETSSAYSLVLRLRVDTPLNNLSGSSSGDGFAVFAEGNYSWNSKKGVRISFAGSTLGTYRYPRIFFGNQTFNLTDAQIPFGNWVDLAISVNGSSVTIVACAQGESGNKLVSKTATLDDVNPALAGGGNTFRFFGPECSGGHTAVWTNGLKAASSSSGENGMRTQHFRGAVHQMAFWNRALTLDEIRMAWGEGRPNLVQVGVEGNDIAEFVAAGSASQTSSVANGGAWQLLNPSLTAENPTATISFTCPTLWAGLPQWLRVCGASGMGRVYAAINGTPVGECNVAASGVGHVFVPTNVIASGENTLVLTRVSGSPTIDAVTLGGSWKFGETVSSFSSTSVSSSMAGTIGPDCWVFNPANGNDNLHTRGTTWSINGDKLTFPFFVPSDLVGHFRGELMYKTATAAGSGGLFSSEINGSELRGETAYAANTVYSSSVPETAFIAGWNEAVWNRKAQWVNFNTWQFTLIPAPVPFVVVVR